MAEILEQTALHVGPLSVSQPFLVIVDPIVSIVLSVWVFAEVFTENAFRLTVGIVAFAVMCAAAAVLARTAPATMEGAAAGGRAAGRARVVRREGRRPPSRAAADRPLTMLV